MVNNTAPSGVAFANVDNANAFQAFNRIDGTYWIGNSNGTGALGYQFTSGKIIKRYSWNINGFAGTNQRPRDWTFQGSNDGVIWVTLHIVAAAPTTSTYYSPDIGNTTSYTYYRINITATQLISNPYINQLDMSESGAAGDGYRSGGGGNLTTSGVTITAPTMYSQQSRLFSCSTGGITVNFIGNTFSNGSTYPINDGLILYNTAASTFNFTGNATLLSSGGNGFYDIYSSNAGAIINFTGNVNRLNSPNQRISFFGVSGNLNFTGDMDNDLATGTDTYIAFGNNNCNFIGNLKSSSTAGVPTISFTTECLFSGNIITRNNVFPVFGRIKMLSSSQNSILFQTENSLITQTLYTPGVATGHPATNNVRTGIAYGPTNNLTGACAVPPAAAVSLGVPVDNTVGTASLDANALAAALNTSLSASLPTPISASLQASLPTPISASLQASLPTPIATALNTSLSASLPAAIAPLLWDESVTNITTPNSIGERLKNCATVATTGAQIASFNP
jgi:hypothetical protein